MKNFPHQINQIPKLVKALEVFQQLNQAQENTQDNGILGYALARQGVYAFRGEPQGEERIRQEKAKPKGSQGARTCARDLRRLFVRLGFVDENRGELTSQGHAALAAGEDPDNDQVRQIWRQVLRDMVLFSENGEISHPYQIMLRILQERPGVASPKLALALEAENDSDEEFTRMLELVDQEDWDAVCEEIEASSAQVQNAVKILPALAKQLGDIYADGHQYYLSETVAPDSSDITENESRRVHKTRRSRKVSANQIAPTSNNDEREQDDQDKQPHLIDPATGIAIRNERTRRHQDIVQAFARMYEQAGYEFYENPMDCLAIQTGKTAVLAEMKTVNGDIDDERSQVRGALAQLLYYEKFNTEELIEEGMQVQKLAVFEQEISEAHQQFLRESGCLVLWLENGEFRGTPEAIQFLNER